MTEEQIKDYLQKYKITSEEQLANHIEELKRNTIVNNELIFPLVEMLVNNKSVLLSFFRENLENKSLGGYAQDPNYTPFHLDEVLEKIESDKIESFCDIRLESIYSCEANCETKKCEKDNCYSCNSELYNFLIENPQYFPEKDSQIEKYEDYIDEKNHLCWIFNRLIGNGENPNIDYMIKLRDIALNYEKGNSTRHKSRNGETHEKQYAPLLTPCRTLPKNPLEGVKETQNKTDYSEIDFDFIEAQALRMNKNKGKYEAGNYKKPMDINLLKQSLFRHVLEVMKDNYEDDGDDLGHLSAIALNAQFLYYQLKKLK